MKSVLSSLLVGMTLFGLQSGSLGDAEASFLSVRDVGVDGFPDDGQFLPRDDSGVALVAVEGTLSFLDSQHRTDVTVELTITSGDWVDRSVQRVGVEAPGDAPFSFTNELRASLHPYDFLLEVVDRGGRTEIGRADGVLVGDVYLIQGQSNAVALDYQSENRANAELQRPWIRSFGSASTNPNVVANDLDWYLAEGEAGNDSGTVGSWALRMAQLLSERFGVPIALLNGAVGGTAISYHLRDDSAPEDLDTNYGRLLFRARQAELADAARGMIWYQGESDGTDYTGWFLSFLDLYADWREDFPGLEEIYVFQIRNSCGFATQDVQSVQRLLPDFLPDVSVIATTATPGHDFCHFFYRGYFELGTQIARIMARDLYGVADPGDIDSPSLERAFYSTPERDEVTLVMSDADDTLIVDPGAENDFVLSDGTDVVGAIAEGNQIVLTLEEPSDAGLVWYRAHAFDGPWVTNARGNGILVFKAGIEGP